MQSQEANQINGDAEPQDIDNSESNINDVSVIDDGNDMTEATDEAVDNEPKSELPSGIDMFSFFSVDDGGNDNINNDDMDENDIENINMDQAVGDIDDDDDDAFNHDLNADIDDYSNANESKPAHRSTKSITDLVNEELEKEINDPKLLALHRKTSYVDDNNNGNEYNKSNNDDNADFVGDINNDDDDDGVDDEENIYMKHAKQWMEKEKELNEDIDALEEDLENADNRIREIEIDHQQTISQCEQEKNDIIKEFEEKINGLNNDNMTIEKKLNISQNEVSTQKEEINKLDAEIKGYEENIKNKEIKWNMHEKECPLLNEEVAKKLDNKQQEKIKRLEEKWKKEIKRIKSGSQQINDSLGRIIIENEGMKDEINELKEEKEKQSQQINEKNLEINRLKQELEEIKVTNNTYKDDIETIQKQLNEELEEKNKLKQEMEKLTIEKEEYFKIQQKEKEKCDALRKELEEEKELNEKENKKKGIEFKGEVDRLCQKIKGFEEEIVNFKENESKFRGEIEEITNSKYELIKSTSNEIDGLRYKIKMYNEGNWEQIVVQNKK